MLENDKLYQQIDAYLRGDMSPSDKIAFENQALKDPLIQHEIELQRAIIEGIKQSRKLALKTSLSSMNISLWSLAVAEATKIAAAIVGGVILIGSGMYIYNQVSSSQQSTVTKTIEKQAELPNSSTAQNLQPSTSTVVVAPVESSSLEANAAQQPAETKVSFNEDDKKVVKTKSVSSSKAVSKSQNVMPSNQLQMGVTEEDNFIIPDTKLDIPAEDPSVVKSGVEVTPSGKVTNNFKTDNLRPEVVYKKHNKDKFYYQYYSNKLTLYGNFDEIVYELLELNTNDGKKLYIYFNDKFYQINNGQVDMAPLKEIADSSLVRELNYLRKKKVD